MVIDTGDPALAGRNHEEMSQSLPQEEEYEALVVVCGLSALSEVALNSS